MFCLQGLLWLSYWRSVYQAFQCLKCTILERFFVPSTSKIDGLSLIVSLRPVCWMQVVTPCGLMQRATHSNCLWRRLITISDCSIEHFGFIFAGCEWARSVMICKAISRSKMPPASLLTVILLVQGELVISRTWPLLCEWSEGWALRWHETCHYLLLLFTKMKMSKVKVQPLKEAQGGLNWYIA